MDNPGQYGEVAITFQPGPGTAGTGKYSSYVLCVVCALFVLVSMRQILANSSKFRIYIYVTSLV